MRAAARLRGALAACALALAATGVALLAAELALRVAAWVSPPAAPVDPELALLSTPWRTNRAGFRGPEVTPEPQPGVFRIAVVGDSFAAGVGVAEQDAYPARLERLLDGSGAGVDFEVLNLGMPGLNIEQVLGRASQLGAGLRPHLYVYGFTLNDILLSDDAERHRHGAQRQATREALRRFAESPSHLVRALGPRWLSLRQAFLPGADDYAGSLQLAYRDPAKLARIERGLDGFAALALRSGLCVHLLIHTELASLRFAHPFRAAYAQVERAARARGLGVTPSFPAYRGRDSARLRLSMLDGHPNAEGHRILAEALYAGLRELPARCQFPALP